MNAHAHPQVRPITELRRAEIVAATTMFRGAVQTMADHIANLTGAEQVVNLSAGHDCARIVGRPGVAQVISAEAMSEVETRPLAESLVEFAADLGPEPDLHDPNVYGLFVKLSGLGEGSSFTPVGERQAKATAFLVTGGYAARDEDAPEFVRMTTIGRAWAERLGI